jgi:hypothetical protein
MRLDHAIFHSPLEPKIEIVAKPKPEGYDAWEKDLPASFPMWHVQDGEVGKTVDYGIVSQPYGFEDSPDCEYISSGVNSKGPKSMALGRQGNWFLWGFAGDPTQMTDSARQVFLNSIVWMRKFDGQVPLGHGSDAHRDNALVSVQFLRAYAKKKDMATYLRDQFPKAMWEQTKGDPDQLEKLLIDNLEYLHVVEEKQVVRYPGPLGTDTEREGETSRWVLDIDPFLAQHAVSNRKPEFLDWFAELLDQRGADDATVQELADRYLPKDALAELRKKGPLTSETFNAWRASVKDRLYFSDCYGYRWFVAPTAIAKAESKAPPQAAGADGSR